jgi:CheY-specific phosphatase CheX
MAENFAQAVQAAVVETFENMTFMEALPRPQADQAPALPAPQGMFIPVTEPVKGLFWLFLPEKLLAAIAENVYVMETEEINQQIMQDTLAELLNTIAGKIMQEALPADQLFSLGFPRPAEAMPVQSDEIVSKYFFEMEGTLFFVAFSGEKLPC